WKHLGSVWSDTWESGAQKQHNFDIVQKSVGRLAMETGLMITGAKIGSSLAGKVVGSSLSPTLESAANERSRLESTIQAISRKAAGELPTPENAGDPEAIFQARVAAF